VILAARALWWTFARSEQRVTGKTRS